MVPSTTVLASLTLHCEAGPEATDRYRVAHVVCLPDWAFSVLHTASPSVAAFTDFGSATSRCAGTIRCGDCYCEMVVELCMSDSP